MINEYQIRVKPHVAAREPSLRQWIASEYGLRLSDITSLRILRRSIDARQRTVYVNLTVRVYVNEQPAADEYAVTHYPDVSDAPTVVVVGAGPGGLFAALRLIECGLRPVVLERGKDVRQRKSDLAQIARTQQVDPESNYCFGEGGAGAYSDGKLYTRSKKRGSIEKILNVFCQHGASTNILADAHPHIGTDKLPRVIENMRHTILRCGGEVHFQTRMTRLLTEHSLLAADGLLSGRVVGVEAEERIAGMGAEERIAGMGAEEDSNVRVRRYYGPVILATGHSARDVYRYLSGEHIAIESKGIAVGVRLEHPSALIDQIQYHSPDGRGQYLPAAEYSFVTQVDGRGVYSFCMCPGGFVIPAATDREQLVVNGMSPSHRAGQWSNSGMVVELRPDDIHAWQLLADSEASGDGIDDGNVPEALKVMYFQQQLERTCWLQGNRRQTAPAQRMADFVNGRLSYDLPRSSYAPGLISSPLHFWLPQPIAHRLQQGFRAFGRQAHGFLTNDAVMIGVETRTSSPVRIVRNAENMMHVGLEGLFPCGEGAGYAGGIVSAAVDGERCAEMCAEYLDCHSFIFT